jgi:hypothetical protein
MVRKTHEGMVNCPLSTGAVQQNSVLALMPPIKTAFPQPLLSKFGPIGHSLPLVDMRKNEINLPKIFEVES